MSKDYYKTLGLEKGASKDEIKAAFKKMARKYHPDLNPDDKEAEKQFKEVSEAFEVLGDDKKRQQYDQFGSFNFGQGGPQNPFGEQYWNSAGFSQVDLEDIFGDVFGFGGARRGRRSGSVNFGGGNPFGGMGGMGQTRGRKGSDVEWKLPIEFLDAVNGCSKQVLLNTGSKITVKIPAGVSTGSKIRVSGKGNPGVAGGAAGDLYIVTEVKAHKYFRREGDDIHLDVPITLAEALKGAKIEIPTIHGNVSMKIPAGSQSGQKMRLKEKGAPNLKTKAKGHQYLHLQIQVPQGLSKSDQEALEKLAAKEKTMVRSW